MFFRSNIANYALYAALLAGVAVLVYLLVTKLLGKKDEKFFGFFDKDNEEDYEEEYDEDDYEDDEDEDDYEDDDEDEEEDDEE